MSESFPSPRKEFGVRGSAPLWFEQHVSFGMQRLFAQPIRYDPKRREPPHSKAAEDVGTPKFYSI